jgi:PPK2 family polyphosphate:nucleotide phosphotransferase
MLPRMSDALRLTPGPVDLSQLETNAAPSFSGSKAEGEAALLAMGPELALWQERLFAERTTGSTRNVLLVLQGMDTSGKGGVLRHTIGLVDPQGVRIKSFKAPTEEEKKHNFLWRIRNALPEPGLIGVFDRSHYEDVLIVKVHGWATPSEIERRYATINEFEKEIVQGGTTLLKCMLHISPDEQKKRLLARLEDPTKHWKYNPGDIDERKLWPAYSDAYERALCETNTEWAPWHVIPSDKKWYRNYAIGQLLLDTLRNLNPQYPPADFDLAAEKARLYSA